MRISVSVSTLLVASSRMRISGSWARARAKESSCFWPVLSEAPRSPSRVFEPLGEPLHEPLGVDIADRRLHLVVGDVARSPAGCSPPPMPLNRNTSWSTRLIRRRRSSCGHCADVDGRPPGSRPSARRRSA